MLFNSLTFFYFFTGVMVLHHLPLPWRVRKFNLLWASYLFYMAWNPPFVLVLIASTLIDWFVGKALSQPGSVMKRRGLLCISLLANLGMLGFFKYGNFLLQNFTWMMGQMGIEYAPPQWDIVLPVGISFYTFQTLTYTFDIYFGKMKRWNSFLDYSLYVTFFPQLVAGPIVRATDFLYQCEEPQRASAKQLSWGLTLLVIGLFEKVVIADGLLAPVVEDVFDNKAGTRFIGAWFGSFAFAGQIFCDFAGYSTCAIGVAMCLGFGIMDNFRFPYAAIGFSDFWRRWHISLSSFLRDYLYIPLGGNRVSNIRTHINLMLTMLIGGLWHGAAWTFVVWGGLHGTYLVGERFLMKLWPKGGLWRSVPMQVLAALGTFLLVCITWVFFRARTFDKAFSMIGSMLGRYPANQGELMTQPQMIIVGCVTVAMLYIHWQMRNTTLEAAANKTPWWLRATLLAIMIVAIVMSPGEDRAFIYFQF